MVETVAGTVRAAAGIRRVAGADSGPAAYARSGHSPRIARGDAGTRARTERQHQLRERVGPRDIRFRPAQELARSEPTSCHRTSPAWHLMVGAVSDPPRSARSGAGTLRSASTACWHNRRASPCRPAGHTKQPIPAAERTHESSTGQPANCQRRRDRTEASGEPRRAVRRAAGPLPSRSAWSWTAQDDGPQLTGLCGELTGQASFRSSTEACGRAAGRWCTWRWQCSPALAGGLSGSWKFAGGWLLGTT